MQQYYRGEIDCFSCVDCTGQDRVFLSSGDTSMSEVILRPFEDYVSNDRVTGLNSGESCF